MFVASPEMRLLHVLEAHAMGCNALSLLVRPTNIVEQLDLCVASGGDDQALSIFSIRGQVDGELIVERTGHRSEACLSAIKGVHWIDDKHIVVSGYDQRVSIWEAASLSKKAEAFSSIGDINCLAFADNLVAVGGSGVELFHCNINL